MYASRTMTIPPAPTSNPPSPSSVVLSSSSFSRREKITSTFASSHMSEEEIILNDDEKESCHDEAVVRSNRNGRWNPRPRAQNQNLFYAPKKGTMKIPTDKAERTKTPSAFAQRAKMVIELKMVALSARLVLLEELSTMTDEEKMDYLFRLFNNNHNRSLAVIEMAEGLRKINGDVGFEETLDLILKRFASFYSTRNTKLQSLQFKEYVNQMAEACGATFHDLAEMLILSIVFSDTRNDELDNVATDIIESALTDTFLKEGPSSREMFEAPTSGASNTQKSGRTDIKDEVRAAMTMAAMKTIQGT